MSIHPMNIQQPVEILLVEDNPGDVRLTREALSGSAISTRLSVVGDGAEALDFLHRRGPHAGAPRPHLILLDLHLPNKTGLQVLAEIKAHADFRRIPVVVLTCSEAADDIAQAYDLHANCYIAKPVDYGKFLHVMGVTQQFWIETVKLPPA